jgi:hypothetical protein
MSDIARTSFCTHLLSHAPHFARTSFCTHPTSFCTHLVLQITADAMFKHLHGSSWHGSDGKYFLWISRNALLFGGTLLLLAFLVIGYFVFHRCVWLRSMSL